MKISDVIIDMHQGINTVADKVEYLNSGIPIIQSKNFTKGYLDLEDVRYLGEEDEKKYIEKYNPHVGDILMANIGTIGKSYVISEEQRFLIAWNAFLIKPNAEKVKSDFLKFYFDYLASTHYFDGLLTGGTVKFINKKKIGDINIPDKSLAEQSEICNVLSQVEKVILQRQQEMELLDDLIKARFVELFGDPMINPKGFPVKTIEEVSVLNKGITYSPEDVADEGMIVLRSSNIKGNVFDLEDLVKITKKISPDKYVQENDILMCNRNGSARLVGKVAMIPKLDENMTFGTFMTIVRSDIYEYLFVFFQMDAFREQIKFQTAVAINQISLPLLASVKVPVPPRKLIDEFAAFTKQVDKSKVAVQKSLDETQQLFDSLMQQYFE